MKRQPSTDATGVERRLVELEVRFTHLADTQRELSDVLYQQQQLLDRLDKRLSELEKRVREEPDPSPPRDPRDDVPPHY